MTFITRLVIISAFAFLCLAKGDPSVYGNFIHDLRTDTTQTNFDIEAQLWIASSASNISQIVYKCESSLLLQAPWLLSIASTNEYFERTYTSLPPHKSISFIFTFFLFDLWTLDDFFSVNLDGSQIGSYSIANPNLTTACNQQHFGEFYVVGRFVHFQDVFQVKIELKRSVIFRNFGFGDIKFQLTNQTTSDSYSCAISTSMDTSPLNDICPCRNTFYSDGQYGCMSCHTNCKECFGPSEKDCYACAEGKYFDGIKCTECPSGCKTCKGPNPDDCMSCISGWWYYWNNTCQPSCPNPLVNDTINSECRVPCQQNNTFALWDYSCVNSCDSPLIQTTQGIVKFCEYPCLLNQTPSSTGICLDECKTPFILQKINGTRICSAPCGSTSDYYFEEKQICQPFCEYPYQESLKDGALFCVSSISNEEMKTFDQLNSVSGIGQTAVSIGAIIASLLSSGDPGSITLASLAKILQYTKFLAIIYPPKLYFSLKHKKIVPTGIAFGPKIDNKVKNLFPNSQELPKTFKAFELHSSFFVNNWEFIFTLTIALILVALGYILERIFRGSPKVKEKLAKIIPAIKWNLFITIFCSGCGDIGLYSALEFITISLNNVFSILSLFLCLIFNGIFLATIILMIRITRNIQMIKKTLLLTAQARKLKNFEKKWEGFTVLFQATHNNSSLQQIYLLALTLRAYLANMIVGLLSSYPFPQTIVLTALSCVMTLYMIFKMPMIKTVNNIQQIFLEILMLIVNACVMALSIMDRQEIEELDRRETIGGIIIIINLIISLSPPVFLVLKLILAIREYFLKKKAVKIEKQTSKPNPKEISRSPSPLHSQSQNQQSNTLSIKFYKSFQPSTLKPSIEECEIQDKK